MGWEVLVRLSPRPLSARPWRVVDVPAALNATIAAVIVELSAPQSSDRVLNAMCGSGTLLVERLARTPSVVAVGVDNDPLMLDAAVANIAASRLPGLVVRGDATASPFPNATFDVVLADLPYGHRSGAHATNEGLYAAFLRECGRIGTADARVVVITHELRRFDRVLAEAAATWRVAQELQVFQKGVHPKVWSLRRA